MIKTQDYKFSVKSLDESGTFEGLAAVYGNLDQGYDVILPGAFTKTLKDHGGKVPLLYQHNSNMPIGMGALTDSMEGLHIKGELVLEVSKARESYALMKRDVLKGLSIGYRTIVDEYDRDKDIRYLKELRLYEVSLVMFPMNLLAQVSAVKQYEDMSVEELIAEAESKSLPKDMVEKIKKLQALAARQAAGSISAPDLHAADNIIKLLSNGGT